MANENVKPEVVDQFIQDLVTHGSNWWGDGDNKSDGNAYALGYLTSMLRNGDFNEEQILARADTLK